MSVSSTRHDGEVRTLHNGKGVFEGEVLAKSHILETKSFRLVHQPDSMRTVTDEVKRYPIIVPQKVRSVEQGIESLILSHVPCEEHAKLIR